MAKEAKKGNEALSTDPVVAKYRAIREEGQKIFESSTFPCPVDGKPASYAGLTGTYQIVVPVFQCPDGHKFSVRTIGQKKATKLLPNQGFTPNSGEAK